jgi:hypothetical protein
MKLVMNQKLKILLISTLTLIVISGLAFSAYYLNRITICEPLSIKITSKKSFERNQYSLHGLGPLGREFQLGVDSIDNSWEITNSYFFELFLKTNKKGLSDTSTRVMVNDTPYKLSKLTYFIGLSDTCEIRVKLPYVSAISIQKKALMVLAGAIKGKSNFAIFILLILAAAFQFSRIQKTISKDVAVRIFAWLFNILFGVTVITICYLAFYIYPSPVDYSIATFGKVFGWYSSFFYYIIGDGRYLTNFLYYIANPLVYNCIWMYKIIPVILLVFLWGSIFILIKAIFHTQSLYRNIIISNAICFVFILLMPNIAAAFFWLAGSYPYLTIIILTNLLTAICIHYFRGDIKGWIFSLSASLIVFCINGLHETAIMATFFWLFYFFLFAISVKKFKWHNILVLLSFILSVFIVLSSKGNTYRMSRQGVQEILELSFFQRLITSISSDLTETSSFIMSEFISTPFIFLLFLLSFLISHYTGPKNIFGSELEVSKKAIWAIVLFPIVLFAIPFPFYFSGLSDNVALGRVQNVMFYYLLFFVAVFFLFLFSRKMPHFLNSKFNRISIFSITLIIFSIFLSLTSENTLFKKTYNDIVYKRLINYLEQQKDLLRILTIRAQNTTLLQLHSIRNRPQTIFYQDVSEHKRYVDFVSIYFGRPLVFDSINRGPIQDTLKLSLRNKGARSQGLNLCQNINMKDFLPCSASSAENLFFRFLLYKMDEAFSANEILNSQGFFSLINEILQIDKSKFHCLDKSEKIILTNLSAQYEGGKHIDQSIRQEELINYSKTISGILKSLLPEFIDSIQINHKNPKSATILLYFKNRNSTSRETIEMIAEKENGIFKISHIGLYDYYSQTIRQKQKYTGSRAGDNLVLVELKCLINPYDSTLVLKALFINNTQSQIHKSEMDVVIHSNQSKFIIPIHANFSYNAPVGNLGEMSGIYYRKLKANHVYDRFLALFLLTHTIHYEINDLKGYSAVGDTMTFLKP